ncbi:four-carbon acid sugar kinase family protein [Streptomonospora nanhaiensis]|uniref:3-oxo-tetronate kinase n=1 Tax=Streptomonospora nanhaiensis TaxID=1323731 RepID=A0ABY6YQW9_9ACTN|nr:3-oxo-tetronate kinase [Streptomonospora nanhaiensis]WAE74747.1 four-carbon acid sugar kinase family protein [Streptomonospora nanhaiensis]
MATLGAIADDLTGATDVAIALTSAGYRTAVVLGSDAPDGDGAADGADAVVVALKSRTMPAGEAVAASLDALARLRRAGCERFYLKYCSTFDSTPAGNIGPVAEAVLEALGETVTVVAPAFPANGRTVYRGHLFVGDEPLDESPMRHHPLTPMTDSNLLRLLAPQVSGGEDDVALVPWPTVARGDEAVREAIARAGRAGARFVVVDALTDADLATLARATEDLRLLTGGSALAQGLRGPRTLARTPVALPEGPRVVLSGSASRATQGQVRHALAVGGGRQLRPADLREDFEAAVSAAVSAALEAADAPFVVYATASPEDVVDTADAPLIEEALAETAERLVAAGTRALLVAGGETSGAVVQRLGVGALALGPEIDPGVAWMRGRRDGEDIHLMLKSGNFGREDLFVRAWEGGL